jgi:tetratricopeptide (TPR) repeat protein
MAKLQCKVCGGKLIMNADGKSSECENCGARYTQEVMRQMLGEVKVVGEVKVAGISDADRFTQNGETFLKLGEWDKALGIYEKMIQQYPSDYRSWWGKFLVRTKMLTLNPWAFEGSYKKALAVASPDSQSMLKKQFNGSAERFEKKLEKLRSGALVKEKMGKYLFYTEPNDNSARLYFAINKKGKISCPDIITGMFSNKYETYEWSTIGTSGYFEYGDPNQKAWLLQLNDNADITIAFQNYRDSGYSVVTYCLGEKYTFIDHTAWF